MLFKHVEYVSITIAVENMAIPWYMYIALEYI